MTGRLVWVLTLQAEDPFVAGGVPLYASTSEQDVWDLTAKLCAMQALEVWEAPGRRGRRTRDEVMADCAYGYTVYLLRLVEP